MTYKEISLNFFVRTFPTKHEIIIIGKITSKLTLYSNSFFNIIYKKINWVIAKKK